MYRHHRRIGALLAGLAVTGALAEAGSAQAATRTVVIGQTQQAASGPVETALTPGSGDFVRTTLVHWAGPSGSAGQRWVERDGPFGNGLKTYESVKFPGRCLDVEGQFSGARVIHAACNGGPGQLWRPMVPGQASELRNIFSNKAVTFTPSQPNHITGAVTQQFFQGTSKQLWKVRSAF